MKTKIISHRGNLNGPDKANENSPYAIKEALIDGYDVEIDVRGFETPTLLKLGHDDVQYRFDLKKDLKKGEINRIWFHCKTIDAVDGFVRHQPKANFFYHVTDDCVLTSKGFVWYYPEKFTWSGEKAVMVLPELFWSRAHEDDKIQIVWDEEFVRNKDFFANAYYGICTDYPEKMKGLLA